MLKLCGVIVQFKKNIIVEIIIFLQALRERLCYLVRTLFYLSSVTAFFNRASFSQISQSNEVSITNNCPCECTQENSFLNQHRHRRSLKRHSSFAVDVNPLPFAFRVCRFFLPLQRPRTHSLFVCPERDSVGNCVIRPQKIHPGSVGLSKKDFLQSSNYSEQWYRSFDGSMPWATNSGKLQLLVTKRS